MSEENTQEDNDNTVDSDSKEQTDNQKSDSQSKKVLSQSRRAGGDSKYRAKGPVSETQKGPMALEVSVDNNIEKAMKILKRKLIKEGLFKELKLRRFYEKPSERRKRKHKESVKKIRKEESRLKKNPYMY